MPHSKKSFLIDFSIKSLQYRCQTATLRKELLARAIGFHPKEKPFIIDATAGFGRDSFILASLHYEVTMLERSPIVAALLNDALQRAKEDPQISSIVKYLHLITTDAISWFHHLSLMRKPDVIYLDPMFPPRKKTAAVKKDMQVLQALLIDQPDDSDSLLAAALTCALHRVVVKRPRYAVSLAAKTPNFSLKGSHSRFDIYLVNTLVSDKHG